ncbi:flotillin domain-containing protein, partial [Rhodococcus qingshengii]|uniref:flotillin domain-containing protein n=1 Tax=Rhodococcus qingshengii TaxID=334542 RepID=UPI001C1636FA
DADGLRARLEAEADGRKVAADAVRAEQQAEADGLRAKLEAEAAGKRQIAEALNSYTPQAAQLLTLPDVLAALVDATAAAAKPVGDIDRISIVGGSDGAQGSIGSILRISPQVIAGVIETLESSGVDITGLLNGLNKTASVPAGSVHNSVHSSENGSATVDA